MRCLRCGPEWSAELGRCAICGGLLAPSVQSTVQNESPLLGTGQITHARLDLSRFDPWVDDLEDGPSLGVIVPPEGASPPPGDAPSPEEAELLALINAARATAGEKAAGAKPLEWDSAAAHVARAHSQDMVDRGFYGHVDPEGDALGQRLARGGVTSRMFAENLAMNLSVAAAHAAFMNEPPGQANHRGNLLNPAFTHVGIGVALGADGMRVITEVLLSR